MNRCLRTAWFAVLLLAVVQAPHAQRTDSLLAGARTTLTAETPEAALDRVRRGLAANPDDATLLALKLRLEMDGVGMAGLPPLARRSQQARTARRLVAVDPADALGNLVVGLDDLREFEFFHDRVSYPKASFESNFGATFGAAGVSPEFMKNRFLRGRFNTDLLDFMFMTLDASNPARGKDDSARRHLEAAIATDPTLRDAYEPLATLGAMLDQWASVAAVAARAETQFSEWGAPVLWQALSQYRTGDPAGAEATFNRALALLSPTDRARYESIEGLLKPAEVERYRADSEAFERAFWSREDVRLLTPANERRAEHYARRTEADLLFGWSRAEGTETPRGRIWARYGAPPKRTRFSGCPYGCILPIPYDVWEYDGFRMVFEDGTRSGAYDTFVPPTSAFSSPDPYVQNTAMSDDYIAVDEQLQREAPEVSTYAPARRERVPFLATPFRGTGGRTDLVVAFGVPLAEAPRPGASVPLAVETGVFALQDGAALPVAERRRSHAMLPASETVPFAGAALWVGAEALRLAPGAYTLAAEFGAPGDVAGFERGAVTVPAYAGAGLEMSGLLLASSATEGASGPVERGGYGIVPSPLAVYAAGQTVTVYAEAYGLGLAGGRSRYDVELVLVPSDERGVLGRLFGRDRRRGVSTQSEASGSRADDAVVVSLDTSGQPAGVYRLALRILDRTSGASVEAEREVTLE